MSILYKFQQGIENTNWDEHVEAGDRWLRIFCWAMFVIAAAYFGPVCWDVLVR
jgi:hypothetical protein